MKKIPVFLSAFVLIAAVTVGCRNESNNTPKTQVPESSPDFEPPLELLFGVYTADKASAVVAEFAPTLDVLQAALEKQLARQVKLQLKISPEYEQGIDNIADGKVHFSRLGPASFVMAKERNPNLELLAMESKSGERVFNGIIAIHKDSEITTLEELRGQSFAFGDPLSTIGRYLSQAELLNVGISGKDFSKFEFLGRHDTVGMAVAAGSFTAGALKESTFKKLVEKGEPIKVLAKFDNVTKPWVAHHSLEREIVQALRSSLLDIQSSSVSKDGFLSATEEHYLPIQNAMKAVDQF